MVRYGSARETFQGLAAAMARSPIDLREVSDEAAPRTGLLPRVVSCKTFQFVEYLCYNQFVFKSFKYRLYPSAPQERALSETLETCRRW